MAQPVIQRVSFVFLDVTKEIAYSLTLHPLNDALRVALQCAVIALQEIRGGFGTGDHRGVAVDFGLDRVSGRHLAVEGLLAFLPFGEIVFVVCRRKRRTVTVIPRSGSVGRTT